MKDCAIEFFEERSAVFEFEAGLPKKESQELALLEVEKVFGVAFRNVVERAIKSTGGGF